MDKEFMDRITERVRQFDRSILERVDQVNVVTDCLEKANELIRQLRAEVLRLRAELEESKK